MLWRENLYSKTKHVGILGLTSLLMITFFYNFLKIPDKYAVKCKMSDRQNTLSAGSYDSWLHNESNMSRKKQKLG